MSEAETKPTPPEEALDMARLEPWLRAQLPTEGPVKVSRFTGGHANLTYLLRIGDEEYVLRRPPLGPVAPGAHDMAREHRVLSVLHQAYPLAPRSLLLCEDPTVVGAVFLIAERRRGAVVTTDLPEQWQGRPELVRGISEMVIDALADLHRVDPATVGLADLGRPNGFVARQLDGWAKRWQASIDKPNPQVDTVLRHLRDTLPDSPAPVLLHNDFKLDNMLVDPGDPRRPVAVLDWDMATRGDPLLDLGYLLNWWAEAGDDPAWIAAGAMPFWHQGALTRKEAIDRYAARTGFDVRGIDWYYAFCAFKLAVILQQIFVRYLRGQTSDARFAVFGSRVEALLDKAARLTGTS